MGLRHYLMEMRKGRFDNKIIDAAGRRLIVSQRTPLSEVDRVISDPQLFTKVKARIAGEQSNDRSLPISLLSLARRHAAAFAVVLALFVAAVGLIANRIGTPVDVARSMRQDSVPDQTTRTLSPPDEIDEAGLVEPIASPQRSERTQIQRASYRRPAVPQHKPQMQKPVVNEDQFYAVSYTGDPAEADTGGRIVRVEMQRSSLFAMGINLPLENAEGTVKADLLIGRDGSTRAIRVVR